MKDVRQIIDRLPDGTHRIDRLVELCRNVTKRRRGPIEMFIRGNYPCCSTYLQKP